MNDQNLNHTIANPKEVCRPSPNRAAVVDATDFLFQNSVVVFRKSFPLYSHVSPHIARSVLYVYLWSRRKAWLFRCFCVSPDISMVVMVVIRIGMNNDDGIAQMDIG